MAARLRALLSRPAVQAALLVLAAAVAYANTLDVPFLFDDGSAITANPGVASLDAFFQAFDWRSNRWVCDLTFALNRQLHGLWEPGFHLVNGLVHAAAGLLVWRLALLLLASPFVAGPEARGAPAALAPATRGAALLAALLFVLHPVQTQAVTYTVQRYTSLAAALYLVALVLFWEARRAEGRRRPLLLLGAALLCTLLALRTKEIAFTLPIALALSEALLGAGSPRARALRLLPFLATLAVIPLALVAAHGSLGGATGRDAFAAQAAGVQGIGRADYLATQLPVVVTYLKLVLWPADLTLDHDFPVERSFFSPNVLLSGLLVAAVVLAAVLLVLLGPRRDRRLRLAGYGLLFFFLALGVESSFVPLDDVMVEHRLYLPMAGVALAAAAGLSLAWDRLPALPAWPRRAALAAAAAVLLALGTATVLRNQVWREPVRFWQDVVAKAPGKTRTHQNLGIAYRQAGMKAAALGELEIAVRLAPRDALARLNLAGLYAELGRLDAAAGEYQALLRLQPEARGARTQLAMIWFQMGLYPQARAELRTVLARHPGYEPARRGLALVEAAQASEAQRRR